MLTIGFPEEWKRFEERHGRFVESLPVLRDACNLAFRRAHLASLADAVVFGLGRVCSEEFWEILVLCGNGYGVASTKLIRSMYERAVTARYIHGHPDEAALLARHSTIEKGKIARRWLEQFRDAMPPEAVETLQRAVTDAKGVHDDGLRQKRDVVSMAVETATLRHLLGSCYYVALLHAHATLHSVEAFIHRRDDGSWTFDSEPQHTEADHALFHAHTILLDVLDLQAARFKPAELIAPLSAAGQAYGAIWKTTGEPSAPEEPA